MGNVIKVGMADLNIAKSPDSLTTLGLGSCIGLTLYDPVAKIGGLVQYMLPDSTKLKNNSNIAKFGDTGIRELSAAGGQTRRPLQNETGGHSHAAYSQGRHRGRQQRFACGGCAD